MVTPREYGSSCCLGFSFALSPVVQPLFHPLWSGPVHTDGDETHLFALFNNLQHPGGVSQL